jgi:hypothetical protein
MHKRFPQIMVLAAILLVSTILVLGLMGFGRPTTPPLEFFPDGALSGYMPEDAAAVVTLRPGEVLEAPLVKQHFASPLRAVLKRDVTLHRVLRPLGMDLYRDLEWVQFSFCARDPFRPLVLLRGRIDPEQFQIGDKGLKELRGGPGDRYRLYETSKDGLTMASIADTLALSYSRTRLENAMAHAAGSRHTGLKDPSMRDLLAQIDSENQLSVAVSFVRLGRVPRLADPLMERLLRPVFDKTATVVGGLKFDKGVHGSFRLQARDDEKADELEKHLQGMIDLARGVARFTLGFDKEWVTLARLLAAAEVQRDGRTILLRLDLLGEILMMRALPSFRDEPARRAA